MKARSTPLLAAALGVALTGAACQGGVESGDGPLSLAAVDPDLLARASLLIFSFATTAACADIVDASPSQIGAALAAENAPLQPVENGPDVSHVFGDVPPDTPVSFLVLATSANRAQLGARIDFADLSGTVFGVGCRDLEAPGGTRHDLLMTLFPVGLR